jgi:hypothetical protein
VRAFVWSALANAVGTVLAAVILSLVGLVSVAALVALLASVWTPAADATSTVLTALGERGIPNWLGAVLAAGCLGLGATLARDRTAHIRVSVDDAFYSGPHPYADPHNVSNAIYQVAITNRTNHAVTITSIKLHLDGRRPLASVEQRESDAGPHKSQYLVPRGGGFSSIPSKALWWRPPHLLQPSESSVGWIGFVFAEPADRLRFREARKLEAQIVVTPNSGRSVRAKAMPCTMPDLGTPWQRRLYTLDEEIEDLRAKALAAEERITGRGDRDDAEAHSEWSFCTGLADEKQKERDRLASDQAG